MVSDPKCPCCNSAMEMHGGVVGGHLHYCNHCYGMLASDQWVSTNMSPHVLRKMRSAVFNGPPAGYSCPTCHGEMVKAPVPVTGGPSIEVDGCLKCGSLWFDNREIEPFVPESDELTPAQKMETPIERTASTFFSALNAVTSKLRQGKSPPEEEYE